MSEELKPCPFCGCEMTMSDSVNYPSPTGEHYYNCPIEGEDIVATEDNWNRRATLSPAHIEDGEEVEVVGYSIEGRDEVGVVRIRRLADRPFPEHMQEARDWAGPFKVASEPLMTVAQHQRILVARAAPHEQAELWAVHVEGPDDLYAAFSREDAERHASELNAIQIPELGVSISAVVIPSPWGAVEHWQYLAEQEREHVESMRAALDAPPAAGVPIGMACKINGYWEAQLFAGHGCIDRQSLYAHPLPPADVPTGLAHRLLKAYDHGDTGAIEAAIEDIRTMLAAAPTPPASEQQRAVVMPELHDLNHHERYRAGWNACVSELLRLNPHLAKGEGV